MIPSQPPAELFVVDGPRATLPICQCFFFLVVLLSTFCGIVFSAERRLLSYLLDSY